MNKTIGKILAVILAGGFVYAIIAVIIMVVGDFKAAIKADAENRERQRKEFIESEMRLYEAWRKAYPQYNIELEDWKKLFKNNLLPR